MGSLTKQTYVCLDDDVRKKCGNVVEELLAHSTPGATRDKVFAFVRERLLGGASPSTREVQAAFGFKAVQTARQHLEALVAEGRLQKAPGQARGYRLPELPMPTSLVPVLGRVQAGALTTAIEYPDGYIPIEANRADGLFALTVQGESMRDAGILPGDTVIVRRQSLARHGEIVVAMVGDEATVKRYRLNNGRVELHPENPAFEVIVPDPQGDTFEILGKVVEIRRKLV